MTASKVIQVGLLGARGRMGQWVDQLLHSEFADRALLQAQVNSGDSVEPLLHCDVVIDFSSPNGMAALARATLRHSKKTQKLPAFAVGSTGWTPEDLDPLEKLAKTTPVLVSPNFSTGVLLVAEILKHYAPILRNQGYTPVLVDTHHRHKKDAPSGTALFLQRVTHPERPESVQTLSVRAGEVVGDHEITFYGPADKITVGHFAQDRSIFARGAIQVGLWLETLRGTSKEYPGLMSIDQYFKSLI